MCEAEELEVGGDDDDEEDNLSCHVEAVVVAFLSPESDIEQVESVSAGTYTIKKMRKE